MQNAEADGQSGATGRRPSSSSSSSQRPRTLHTRAAARSARCAPAPHRSPPPHLQVAPLLPEVLAELRVQRRRRRLDLQLLRLGCFQLLLQSKANQAQT